MNGPAHAGPFSSANAFTNAVSDPRFHVDLALKAGTTIDLPDKVAHHAARVLRLADGAAIVLFDGRGGEYPARLAERGRRAELLAHVPVERESPVAVTLVQAWSAADKIEWVVEKAVELGVARVVLCPTRRSVIHLDAARLARRLERLREIAVSACCQCGRNRVPEVTARGELKAALEDAGADATRLLLHPEASAGLAGAVGDAVVRVALAAGPEGGFAPEEVEVAVAHGYLPVRLGPRVLRTETAGLAALATLAARVGDFR